MRRIALCLYALCLLLPVAGCAKEETTPAPSTTDTTTTTEGDAAGDAADAGDGG